MKKNPAAVALGKLGGEKGGKVKGVKKGFAALSEERKKEIANAGVAARREKS